MERNRKETHKEVKSASAVMTQKMQEKTIGSEGEGNRNADGGEGERQRGDEGKEKRGMNRGKVEKMTRQMEREEEEI